MTKIQLLEREVKKLDRASLEAFRNWFRRYDSDAWGLQIKRMRVPANSTRCRRKPWPLTRPEKLARFEAFRHTEILTAPARPA